MRQQVDRADRPVAQPPRPLSGRLGAVRLEAGDIDMTAVARAVIAEFRPGAETPRRRHRGRLRPVELAAACDERRVSQVLRALLDNAVKFSPQGGTVAVGLAVGGRRRYRRRRDLITIADQGPGIPHDELARVFERFFRGKRRRPQVGHRTGPVDRPDMVELMGGTLTVRSTRGAGATFTVRMPRNQG